MGETTAMHSSIYQGWIRHRRFTPVNNAFKYPIFMMYLDLDEVEAFFKRKWYCGYERFNLVSYKRQDFFEPEKPDLKQAVIDRVLQYYIDHKCTTPDIHSVRMLGHVRYFGFNFNPVVFYYCFDAGNRLQAILSEITNTPWGERHSYVHAIEGVESLSGSETKTTIYEQQKKYRFEFEKRFHVSPFNPMNMDYNWVFSQPSQKLHVHMDNLIQSNEAQKHFDATLMLDEYSLKQDFGKIMIRQPFITVKVVLGIYWQALKLWVKRSPFYDHPNTVTPNKAEIQSYDTD